MNFKIYKDGEPCKHPGCLQHVTHPCEGCGRIAGKYDILQKIFAKIAEFERENSCRPRALYVGINELYELKDHPKVFEVCQLKHGEIEKIFGLSVCPQNEESILEVKGEW